MSAADAVLGVCRSQGHIGMQGGGWIPKRNPANSGLLPVPAWDEENHWRGRLDNYYLPHSYDPPEGFIATANENINTLGDPPIVTMPVPDYRKRRIVERLRQLPQATVSEMQQLQYDVISVQARELLQVFLPHVPEGSLKNRLSAWNCSYDPAAWKRRYLPSCIATCCWKSSAKRPTAKEGASVGDGCCISRPDLVFR